MRTEADPKGRGIQVCVMNFRCESQLICGWSGQLMLLWVTVLLALSPCSQSSESLMRILPSRSTYQPSIEKVSSCYGLAVLRGGGSDEEDVDEEDEIVETKVPEGYWRNPRTGRYKDLPDDETAIQWRIADWYLDRRGAGSKERHAKSRESGKHLITEQMSLRKRPLESRRDKQGANAFSRNVLDREILTFSDTMFAGTRYLSTRFLHHARC